MCRFQCSLAAIAILVSAVNSWDIAITTGSQIDFLNNVNVIKKAQGIASTGLTALAYDAVHNMLLYVDKQSDNASIFRYNLATNKAQALVGRKSFEDIKSLAFDPVSNKIFWIDRDIYWKSLKSKDIYGQKLNVDLTAQVPNSIAVDSCRGFIYWINKNVSRPTIERAHLDGTGKEVIIKTDIQFPISLTIDQQTRRLFWTDDREGIHYSIESSDLEGGNRRTVTRGIHHIPEAITVSKDYVYWLDTGYKTLWKLPKDTNGDKQPIQVLEFIEPTDHFTIAANYTIEDQTRGVKECETLRDISKNKTVIDDSEGIPGDTGVLCLHGKKIEGKSQCQCKPGYKGERCEVPVCENYCLNGKCSLTASGGPQCSCLSGYIGLRCEINPCVGRCLNNAECIIKDQKATCLCNGGDTGDRCEIKSRYTPEDSCNCTAAKIVPTENIISDGEFVQSCNDGWDPLRDPIIMVLGTLCGLLCVACAVLFTKILQLKKRPRIKKRIIVQKNSTPLTARPDQCEITIENCCNMNICETPCFEPRSTIRANLLDAKPGKEEKKNLIANMELPDDY